MDDQKRRCGVPAANHAVGKNSAVLQELGLLKG